MVTNTEPTDAVKGQDQPSTSRQNPLPAQETRPISCLRSHQLNIDIYCDEPSAELTESIRIHGVLEPILITRDNRIVSGHRRRAAAFNAGLQQVPVRVVGSTDPLEIEELLIHCNKQRRKTNEQLAKEAQHLFRIERERAKRRQATGGPGCLGGKPLPAISPEGVDCRQATGGQGNLGGKPLMAISPEAVDCRQATGGQGSLGEKPLMAISPEGVARDIAAKTLGIGGKKLEEAAFVAETLEHLKEAGKSEQFHELRKTLNGKSIHRAFQAAKALSLEGTPLLSGADDDACVLLSTWDQMTPEQKAAILSAPRKPLTFNVQAGDTVDSARFAWNPVSGCLHNCPYCCAQGIAERSYPHGFAPALYPDQLDAPLHMVPTPKAAQDMAYRNVIVVSIGDLFGRWVPRAWIEAVLGSIRNAPQWNFLLLTKNPARLLEFEFPTNAWVGTTVDRQERVKLAEQVFAEVKASVKWLSCEPLLEDLTFSNLGIFQWVVIGGASKTLSFAEYFPPRDHVQHLWAQADALGVKVFEKANLLERRREFPERPATT